MSDIAVRVVAIEQVTPAIKRFTLAREDGGELPAFSGGSHVVLTMQVGARILRNAYSLMSSPADTRAYQIAVRREEKSRGGSASLHRLAEGALLQISAPANLFPLSPSAPRHLMIAGGIGVTPFMSQLHDIASGDYALHYAYRAPEHGAFCAELKARCGGHVHFYVDSLGQRLDIARLLAHEPADSHVYVCGPATMVAAVRDAARALGWADGRVHSEQFTAAPVGEPFKAHLARSGIDISVASDATLLEAIEQAGVEAASLCRGGACGRCEVEVLALDGELIHHDSYLSEEARAAGNKILPCVSRARCNHLVLDL